MKKLFFLFYCLFTCLYHANAQYVTNGTAISTGSECFRLTQAINNQGGTVWFQNKISLASDLSIDATIYLGSNDGGADGLAFVLQPVCSGLGGSGGGLGYQGLAPSLAVEFDTYQNSSDPVQDHIGLMKNGNVTHGGGGASTLQGFNTLGNLENGFNHLLKIRWIAITKNLQVTLDGIPQINYTDDIVANIFSGNRNVFWGFTAATGSLNNEHRVCVTYKDFVQEGSFVVTKPSCPSYSNGAIVLNAAGGIGPFTYAWSNGATTKDISGLLAGNYSVTVRDGNGCNTVYNNIVVANEPDVTPPTISCPGDISVLNDAGICGAVLNYPAVTATDNCSNCPSSNSIPGYTFYGSFGGHLYFRSDNAVSWPAANAAAASIGGHLATITSAGENAFLSNATLAWIGLTDQVNEGTFRWITGEPLGYTNWLAGEPNNGGGNEDYVEINRGGPGLWNDLPNGFPRVYYVEFDCMTITQTAGLPSGSIFPVGPTLNTFEVTDAAGNMSTCSFTVTVTDNEAPVITTNGDQSVNNDPGECGAIVPVSASATDNCSVGSPIGVRSDALSLTDPYPVGTTTITWNVTDVNGNAAGAVVQTVKVTDNEAPVITANGDQRVNNDPGECGAIVPVSASATDNCSVGSPIGVRSDALPLTDPYPVGTTTITWNVTDINGNAAGVVVQTVKVTDNEAPVATCQSVTVTLSGGTATITTAMVNNGSTDNCGIQSYGLSKSTFDCSNIGANTVTLTVTDVHGNTNTCTAVINVIGEIPTCSIASIPSNNVYTGGVPTNLYLGYGPQSTTLQVSAPASGAPYTYSWSSTAAGLVALNLTNPAAPVFTPTAPGNYTFVVTTTNKYGCSTTCSIVICVLDVRVPGTAGKKIYVCHVPSGNPGNPQTLSISINAVPTHISVPGHGGDRLGTCDQTPCGGPSVRTIEKGPISLNVLHADVFQISAAPNPSSGSFNMLVRSSNQSPVEIRVIDMSGRIVFRKTNVAPNTNIRIGENFGTGGFFVEAIQGGNRQTLKLLKAKQ